MKATARDTMKKIFEINDLWGSKVCQVNIMRSFDPYNLIQNLRVIFMSKTDVLYTNIILYSTQLHFSY
jgi:hypothetical protein